MTNKSYPVKTCLVHTEPTALLVYNIITSKKPVTVQTIYIWTLDKICARCWISEDRVTTNTCFTVADALQMLYGLRFSLCNNFLLKTWKLKELTMYMNKFEEKNHITGSNIKLTIKNQTIHFSIWNVLTQNSGCNITCSLEILELWAYTQSCLYMYLFAYHDQLFKGNDEFFIL